MYKCAYSKDVGFEWDAGKAGTNLRKHRVDFADAATALEDPFALTMRDESQRTKIGGSRWGWRRLAICWSLSGPSGPRSFV